MHIAYVMHTQKDKVKEQSAEEFRTMNVITEMAWLS